jgi:hypothetical protein
MRDEKSAVKRSIFLSTALVEESVGDTKNFFAQIVF